MRIVEQICAGEPASVHALRIPNTRLSVAAVDHVHYHSRIFVVVLADVLRVDLGIPFLVT